MREQEYILLNGGDEIIGQSIFMQRSAASQKTDYATSDELNRKMGEIIRRNKALRDEFRKRVEKGEIHEDTIEEILVQQANGHLDNEATLAARRCCIKRGIEWITKK